jgi:hypothetical protein
MSGLHAARAPKAGGRGSWPARRGAVSPCLFGPTAPLLPGGCDVRKSRTNTSFFRVTGVSEELPTSTFRQHGLYLAGHSKKKKKTT